MSPKTSVFSMMRTPDQPIRAVLTMMKMRPTPATMRLVRMLLGKEGSLTPVIGFFCCMGALAANSGRGRSSSSWKSRQSQWWASDALLRFQYSRNDTAGREGDEVWID